ncbi:transcriptional regulator [Amycolatopsis antarctica]|uniref:Transcriptional regulator n=1 Tax=Amycolatopsis antarctica TaxID=1854586 RepID=A0A263D3F5_9PSEU|nr:helix-turn-helix domain-containing protein [Amycolatopsis antarctica]OZM72980.1 transcriptional regulator [Amycolatopsis antarctica]
MAKLPPRKRVRDVELMRALSHPTRFALLGYLMATGAHTASECAAAVDSSPSNCSWHLRQLAQYGLVERSETGDGRERPWQAAQVGLDLGTLGSGDGALHGAQIGVAGAQLAEDRLLTQRFLDTADRLDPAWRDAAALTSYALRVTPDELAALREAVDTLIRPYVVGIRIDAPAAARPVHASVRGFPRIEADGNPAR